MATNIPPTHMIMEAMKVGDITFEAIRRHDRMTTRFSAHEPISNVVACIETEYLTFDRINEDVGKVKRIQMDLLKELLRNPYSRMYTRRAMFGLCKVKDSKDHMFSYNNVGYGPYESWDDAYAAYLLILEIKDNA